MDFCRWFTVPGRVTHGTCVSSINVRLWACNLSATIRHPDLCLGMSASLTQRLCLFCFCFGAISSQFNLASSQFSSVNSLQSNMGCLSSDVYKVFHFISSNYWAPQWICRTTVCDWLWCTSMLMPHPSFPVMAWVKRTSVATNPGIANLEAPVLLTDAL